MRILHVTPSYVPAYRYGGVIQSVHGLCRALAARGHDVEVFTTTIDGTNDTPAPGSPVSVEGVRVSYFPPRLLRRLYYAPPMRTALDERIASFDLVHLHSIFLWPTFAAARAARDRGLPYLLAPRGMLVRELIQRKSRWAKTAWLRLVEQRNVESAAALHFTSKIEEREASAFGWRLPPAVIVPNGVDLLPDMEPSASPDSFLFVGRINWKKGLDLLIDALRRIPSARLKIAGNDEDGYQGRLQQRIQELGIQDRVEFVGFVNDDAKWDLYRGAIALVLPSISENFGNVVLEAMAVGCPVIVTRAVGLAPTVEEGSAGLVVNAEAGELAEAMVELQEDPVARRFMGSRGRAIVQGRFTWDAVSAEMEAAYRRIIQ